MQIEEESVEADLALLEEQEDETDQARVLVFSVWPRRALPCVPGCASWAPCNTAPTTGAREVDPTVLEFLAPHTNHGA